jgi:hypothetical protein
MGMGRMGGEWWRVAVIVCREGVLTWSASLELVEGVDLAGMMGGGWLEMGRRSREFVAGWIGSAA